MTAPTNETAGYSSMCFRGNHVFCATARANCTCTCHGQHGQTAPPPARATGPARARAQQIDSTTNKETRAMTIDPDPTPAALPNGLLACDDCPGRTFPHRQALALHRTRTHSTGAPAGRPAAGRGSTKLKKPAPAKPTVSADTAATDDHHIVLVLQPSGGGAITAETAACAPEVADQLATILGRLGHRTFIVNPAGPSLAEYDHDGLIG